MQVHPVYIFVQVRWNTLDKFPTSRLGRLRHCVTHRGNQILYCTVLYCTLLYCTVRYAGLLQICDSYSLDDREYFFDRSPRNFDAILGLYRNGKLHLAAGVSGETLAFIGVPVLLVQGPLFV